MRIGFDLFCLFGIRRAKDENALEIDFGAFDALTPHLTLPSSIGNGLQFISKFLSSKLHEDLENSNQLLDYLLALNYRGQVRNIQIKIKTNYENKNEKYKLFVTICRNF